MDTIDLLGAAYDMLMTYDDSPEKIYKMLSTRSEFHTTFGDIKYGDYLTIYIQGLTAYVTIRGSDKLGKFESLSDWISNFNMTPNYLGIHTGFYEVAERYSFSVIDWLKGKSFRRIQIQGHSRGGGIAIILASMLYKSLDTPIDIITFGAPKAFIKGSQISEELTLGKYPYFRVVNGADIVPCLPAGDGYIHRESEFIQLGSKASFKDRLVYAWKKFRNFNASFKGVDDHNIMEYIRMLENS